MISLLKEISLFLLLGLLLNVFSFWIESNFLIKFLEENLIILMTALMAINATTLGVILTKIKPLAEEKNIRFHETIKEMKRSVIEQVVLIALVVIVQILKNGKRINFSIHSDFVFSSVLTSIFCYSIYILYDTANAIFIISEFEQSN